MKHKLALISLIIILMMSSAISAQENCGIELDIAADSFGIILPGSANNVRAMPSTTAEFVGQIPSNGWFKLLGEAACSGGFTWYEVESPFATGWTAVSSDDEAYILPYEGLLRTDSALEFILPLGLADEAIIEVIEEERGFPSYRSITFENYADADTEERLFRFAEIRIFEATAFNHINGMAASAATSNIPRILDVLDEQTALDDFEVDDIPEFSPGASQIAFAKPLYIPAYDGRGYRYVAAYAQDLISITNEGLEYRYQGFTANGDYFIDAIFPIDAPEDLAEFDYDAASDDEDFAVQDFADYSAEIHSTLDSFSDMDFTPNLYLLDALIASLQIEDLDE